MASIEAARQNIHPIPENAEDPIIQEVFARIRNMNANLVLMQNGMSSAVNLPVKYIIMFPGMGYSLFSH